MRNETRHETYGQMQRLVARSVCSRVRRGDDGMMIAANRIRMVGLNMLKIEAGRHTRFGRKARRTLKARGKSF